MNYDMLIIDPLREMLIRVWGFVPKLVVPLGILIFGYLVVKMLTKALHSLFHAVNFDKGADRIGTGDTLKKGGIKHKPSELLTNLVYWIGMIMVLIMTVKAIGLTMVSDLLDKVLAYIPDVISGVLVLVFGMLVAKVVSGIVHTVASVTDIPHPDVLSRLTKYAVVLFAAIVFIREIGYGGIFEGTHGTIVFGGFVLTLALAFGLAGKDVAAKYLDVFKKNGG